MEGIFLPEHDIPAPPSLPPAMVGQRQVYTEVPQVERVVVVHLWSR